MFIIPRGFGKNSPIIDICYCELKLMILLSYLEIFLALLCILFLKIFYIISIFAPNLFISSMKFGYDTSTDFESVTIQFPIYVPAIQNAINNL